MEGKVRAEKLAKLQHQIIAQRSLFTKSSNEDESSTKTSYKVAYVLAKRGKPFTDREIVKDCLLEVAEECFPEKAKLFKNLTVGANIVARRIGCMGENIINQIASNARKFRHFSLAMGESLNMCDTSQLLVFNRGVSLNVTLELAFLNSVHGTVTVETYSMS